MCRLFFICLLLVFCTGCSAHVDSNFSWKDSSVDLRWPSPPASPRIVYLRSITGPEDFAKEKNSNQLFRWFFGEEDKELSLVSPYAVAFAAPDVLWVADNGSRMVYRIDLQHEEIDYFNEFDDKRLISPVGLAVDQANERIYIADSEAPRVCIVDFSGRYIGELSPPVLFRRPAGIAVDPAGQVYVADALQGLVFVFDRQGRYVRARGSKVAETGLFSRPVSVAIGPRGELIVVDALAFHVEVQDEFGSLFALIGSSGDAPGSFARPRTVVVTPEGQLFVADAAFDNIQVFDLAGRLLMYFGGPGKDVGRFNFPSGLFFDHKGRLFVADSYNHRIQVFEFLGAE